MHIQLQYPFYMNNNIDVFISRNKADAALAKKLHDYLLKKGLKVFDSDINLPKIGISDYRKAIDTALEETQHMVIVASSRHSLESEWVEAEWGLFINEKRSGRKKGNILTVIAGDMTIQQLPASLRYYEVVPYDEGCFEKVLAYVKNGNIDRDQQTNQTTADRIPGNRIIGTKPFNNLRLAYISLLAIFSILCGVYFFGRHLKSDQTPHPPPIDPRSNSSNKIPEIKAPFTDTSKDGKQSKKQPQLPPIATEVHTRRTTLSPQTPASHDLNGATYSSGDKSYDDRLRFFNATANTVQIQGKIDGTQIDAVASISGNNIIIVAEKSSCTGSLTLAHHDSVLLGSIMAKDQRQPFETFEWKRKY